MDDETNEDDYDLSDEEGFISYGASASFDVSKSMGGPSSLNGDSQNNLDLNPQTGNPILIILLSLLSLIIIPLRNR